MSSSSTTQSRPPSSRSSTPTRCSGRSTSCSSASTRSVSPRPSSTRPARTRSRSTCRASRTPRRRPAGRLDRPAVLLRLGSQHPGRKCKTNPDQNAQPAPADRRPARGGRAGVQVHERRHRQGLDPLADDSPGGQSQAAAKPRYYVFDKTTKKPLNNGQTFDTARGGARVAVRRREGERRGDRGPGRRARAARAEGRRDATADPTAGGSSRTVRASRARTSRTRSRASTAIGNEPIVTFNFSDQGRKAFQAITRRVAQRGADNALGGDPLQTSQHFAIALDNELVSAPYINWQENPTASTARPAPRSPAASRSSRRRTWRRSSRSARCR